MRDISELIGTEFTFEGDSFKVFSAEFEGDMIILKTEKKAKDKKKYAFSEQSLRMFKNVHPNLVKIMKAAIPDSPYDFRITAGARTAEEQNALYQIGRTRAGSRVTNCDGYKSKSNHQIKADGYGYAVDIFVCGKMENGTYIKYDTKEGYDYKKLKEIADHIKAIAKVKGYRIEWGGDWKGGWDSPHFELRG